MSLAQRLVHRLAIVTPAAMGDAEDPDDLDGYGLPTADDPTVELVRGLVQPRTAREVELANQGGAPLTDHVVFLLPMQLSSAAYIADADEDGVLDGGRRFEIVGIRDFAFGRSPHLEVDTLLIGAAVAPAVGS